MAITIKFTRSGNLPAIQCACAVKQKVTGIVPGGAPYTDRVPAMLTPGERVIPAGGNDEMVALLKELISEVRKGGNVYLDGSKVGHVLAMQSSQMG